MASDREDRQRVLLVELRRALIETDVLAWKKRDRLVWLEKINRVLGVDFSPEEPDSD